MQVVRKDVRRCCTCSTWFGGQRFFEANNVKYDANPHNTGICKHPLSSRKEQSTRPEFTCPKWVQGS
jgi:hypothetical protein